MDISIEWFNLNSGFMTFIAAMVALIVGIIAAVISIWNTLITQRGLRLQYQPELLIKTEDKGGGFRNFYVVLENIGLGTAYQIEYNQEFIEFIREWTHEQQIEIVRHGLSLEPLKSGEFREYFIPSKFVPGNPKTLEVKIDISYTDIFKKFEGKVEYCLMGRSIHEERRIKGNTENGYCVYWRNSEINPKSHSQSD